MPRTTTPEALALHPGDLGKFLDECWKGWREGFPPTDYILYSPGDSSTVYMIGLRDGESGWLDIDGQACYSAAWL